MNAFNTYPDVVFLAIKKVRPKPVIMNDFMR